MGLFGLMLVQAQNVGINNDDPKATLDVVGKPTVETSLDGIIAPRMTGDQLKAKTYGVEQKGAFVYVTSPVTGTPEGQTLNVIKEGQYFFDGEKWLRFLDTKSDEVMVLANPIELGDITGGQTFHELKSDGIDVPQYIYSGYSITLPPGKWVVYSGFLLPVAKDTIPPYDWNKNTSRITQDEDVWVRFIISLKKGTLEYNPKNESIGPPWLISGAIVPGSRHGGVINGTFIVENKGVSDSTYYVNGEVTVYNGFNDASDTRTLKPMVFQGTPSKKFTWSENYLYAIRVRRD